MDLFLSHLIKTIRFRFEYAVSEIDDTYPELSVGQGVRTPIEILHHMQGLMHYVIHICGGGRNEMKEMSDWPEEKEQFLDSVTRVEQFLANAEVDEEAYLRIIQGPLADALTHIGQLAMMSRLSGKPLPKLNYSKEKI